MTMREHLLRTCVAAVTIVAVMSVSGVIANDAEAAKSNVVGAYVWGSNVTGGLGTGSSARVAAPTPVSLPKHVVSVAVGADYTIGLTSSGRLYAWGGNQYGQLGDGTTKDRLRPVAVKLPAGVRVRSVAANRFHTVAVTAGGRVYAWGRNEYGQLGVGNRKATPRPRRVRLHQDVVQVATGVNHSLALTASGRVYAWGANHQGQLGTRTLKTHLRPIRVAVPSGNHIVAIAAEGNVSVALTSRGKVLQWGESAAGSLVRRPSRITGAGLGKSPMVSLDAGYGFVIALAADGTLHGWGRNSHGQLGNGTRSLVTAPIRVRLPHGAKAKTISVAGNSVLAVTTGGRLYSWGANTFGQLGAGTTKDRKRPTRLKGLAGAKIVSVEMGINSGIALVSRGPAARLKLSPANATVTPGHSRRYTVRATDAFGNNLGPFTGKVTLNITGGRCSGRTCRASTPGVHYVTVTAGRGRVTTSPDTQPPTGSATLRVKR
jgi:alpha-tubulin suppressor-like RCC1 family protein